MLMRLNKQLERWMPLITPLSVLVGVLFASSFDSFVYLVPWIFAGMTLAGSLGINFRDLQKVILHPLPLLGCLAILHILMPLFALAVAHTLFGSDPYMMTGLVLAFVIPTGIISFMWVSIYQGNAALTLSIILVSTLLSPLLVPYSLELLVGSSVQMDIMGMMRGLFWMVVLPSLVGMTLNQLTRGKVKQVGSKLSLFTKLGLATVIIINSSVVAPYFKTLDFKLVGIIVTMFTVAVVGYIAGWLLGGICGWKRDTIVALTFNSGMRNISAGCVLAVTYFPPAVAMPVIVAMLFQQFTASMFGHALSRRYGPKTDSASVAAGAGVTTAHMGGK